MNQNILELMNDATAITNSENKFTYINPAFSRLLENKSDQFLDINLLTIISPEYRNQLYKFLKEEKAIIKKVGKLKLLLQKALNLMQMCLYRNCIIEMVIILGF